MGRSVVMLGVGRVSLPSRRLPVAAGVAAVLAMNARPIRALLALVMLLGLAKPLGVEAAQASSAIVGSSTVSFTSEWEVFDSSPTAVVLQHRDARRLVFSYLEMPDQSVPVTDNAALIEALLREQGVAETSEQWGEGTLADGTLWRVYAVTLDGGRFVLIATGNTEAIPGADVVTTLLTTETNVSTGHGTASRDITVNGGPHAIAGIELDVIFQIVWEGMFGEEGTPEPTPTPVSEPPTPPFEASPPTPGDVHVTTSGSTISWAAPWVFDDNLSIVGDTFEAVFLTNGTADVVVIDGRFRVDNARTLSIEQAGGDRRQLTTIDQGSEGIVSYWLDQTTVGGVVHGAFTLLVPEPDGMTGIMTIYLSPVPSFAHDMASVQASITVNGAGILEGVEGSGLQTRLEASAPAVAQPTGTVVADTSLTPAPPVPGPGDLTLPPLDATIAPTPAPTPAAALTPSPTAAAAASDVPYADAGMVAPGHYVSPNSGVEVRWNLAAWSLDPYLSPPVVTGYDGDELHLAWNPDDNIWISMYAIPSYGATLDEFIDVVRSSSEVTAFYGPTAELVMSTSTPPRGAIVVRDANAGFETWMYYSEFYLINDGTVIVEVRFSAPVPMAEETLTAAQQITLNGQPVMTYYPVQDVLAAVGP